MINQFQDLNRYESYMKSQYQTALKNFQINKDHILEVEKKWMKLITDFLLKEKEKIKKDYDSASVLQAFWSAYPPSQRGRGWIGDAFPWGEVGEKLLEGYLYSFSKDFDARFVGLPFGHDVRFLVPEAFIHIDVKSTGPRDRTDEVVVSPNQVSGDGHKFSAQGIQNSPVMVSGARKKMLFQPELPPIYCLDGNSYLTLTFYIKCVYRVEPNRAQPLDYLEVICVPNGIIMFGDATSYFQTVPGLFTPGKDETTAKHKRTRIKLSPLMKKSPWRCSRIYFNEKD